MRATVPSGTTFSRPVNAVPPGLTVVGATTTVVVVVRVEVGDVDVTVVPLTVGEVVVVDPTGAETELLIQAGQAQLTLVTHGRPGVRPGDRVGVAVTPGKVHVFDQGTGSRLAA